LPGSQQNYSSEQHSEAKQSQESDTHQGNEQSGQSISEGVECSDSQTQSHIGREEQSRSNSNENHVKQHKQRIRDGKNVNKCQNSPLNGNNKDKLRSGNSFGEAQAGVEERKKSVTERLHVGAQKERGGISPKVWCGLLLCLIKSCN
jgi:hypothetical protein